MPSITVKNIPDELYDYLKEVAAQNHRSINSEIIVCIERAVRSQRLTTDAVLTRARRLREQTRRAPITDAQFTKAKSAGRS